MLGELVNRIQHGVMVINQRGDTAWTAYGDGHLSRFDNYSNHLTSAFFGVKVNEIGKIEK